MMEKPKIALYWCSSCGGCEESVIDLAEDILTLAELADVVFWPVALDYKKKDLEALGKGEIRVSFINGAVRMDEQEMMARLLREKSQIIVAHGSCAHTGGVVGLANFFSKEEILRTSYCDVPTVVNPGDKWPGGEAKEIGRGIHLSDFHHHVKALDQVIKVDYYIPGCPPTPELIKETLKITLEDLPPPAGKIMGESEALCHTCPRGNTRISDLKIKKFKRLYQTEWDPETCFLNQSIICLGPATRGGCRARCIGGNMPCLGCFGPTDLVKDQGARSLSFLASMVDSENDEVLSEIMDSIPDPAGLFYRYGLAASLLQGRIPKDEE